MIVSVLTVSSYVPGAYVIEPVVVKADERVIASCVVPTSIAVNGETLTFDCRPETTSPSTSPESTCCVRTVVPASVSVQSSPALGVPLNVTSAAGCDDVGVEIDVSSVKVDALRRRIFVEFVPVLINV